MDYSLPGFIFLRECAGDPGCINVLRNTRQGSHQPSPATALGLDFSIFVLVERHRSMVGGNDQLPVLEHRFPGVAIFIAVCYMGGFK